MPGTFNTTETWRIALQSDVTLNDSDKSFVVPAATEQQIFSIWVELTTTATVGDRQLVIELQETGADVISQWARAAIVQAASLTKYYSLFPCAPDLSAWRDTDFLTTPIPPSSFLQTGDILRVYDNNAVDAAADDMIVHIKYGARAI